MSNPTTPSSDPVIDAVRRLSVRWKTSEHAKRDPVRVGKGNLYTVVFRGEDGYWRENYVFENDGKLTAYKDLHDMLMDRSNGLLTFSPSIEVLKVIGVLVLALILTIAVVSIVWQNQENKNLTMLTGFLGSTIGYLIGKSDSK